MQAAHRMSQSSASVVLLSGDLLATSTVSNAAAQAGLTLRTAVRADQLREATGPGDLILIDLATPGLDPEAVAAQLTALQRQTAVVYGPHVHTSRFEQAHRAGFQTVIPRGRFMAEVTVRLKQFAGTAEQ